MRLFELNEPAKLINWIVPKACQRAIAAGRAVVVWVDPAKIDPEWAKDANFYVGRGGTHNAIRTRYPDFGAWLEKGEAVEMSEIGYGYRDRPSFTNGRHRFAWMRDHGATAVPVVTDADRAEEFAKQFGASEKQTRIS